MQTWSDLIETVAHVLFVYMTTASAQLRYYTITMWIIDYTDFGHKAEQDVITN